jgi:hypothetical protein
MGGGSGGTGNAQDTGGVGTGGFETGGAGTGGWPALDCEGFFFCDDFNDQDAEGWSVKAGVWTVVVDGTPTYVLSVDGVPNRTIAEATSALEDQTVEARMKVVDSGGTDQNCRAGIIAREGGAASNYLFALDATGNFQILRGTGPPSGASGDCAPAASGLGALPEGIWVDDVRVSQP